MPRPPRKIVELKRPLYRRLGRKVLRIDAEGLWLRGKHKRTWHGPLSWAEIASLLEDRNELLDAAIGEKMLEKIGAN
jgi:hypothetical protein